MTQSLWITWKLFRLQGCVKGTGLWLEQSKLKLNNDKTKAIRFSLSSSVNLATPTDKNILSSTNVEFAGIVHNLSLTFDSDLSVKQHIIKACKAAYIEIRCISSIHQYLTED